MSEDNSNKSPPTPLLQRGATDVTPFAKGGATDVTPFAKEGAMDVTPFAKEGATSQPSFTKGGTGGSSPPFEKGGLGGISSEDKIQSLIELSNQELAAFSFAIGHDFRNSLNHIVSFIKLLELNSKAHFDEKSLHYLEMIQERGKHLETMIKAVQNYGNIARSKLHLTDINTNAMIQEIIKNFKTLEQSPPIQWEIEPLPNIYADPILIRQAFEMILKNSIKFSASQDPIVIKISSANNSNSTETVFAIQDNGVGFDAKEADRLFWPFQRFHGETEFPGLGMGLAMVRRIMQMHQGSIQAKSEEGKGATFYMALPKVSNSLTASNSVTV